MITPEGERTFATFLGAATALKFARIPREAFESYRLLHVEGYLVIEPALLEPVLKMARERGLEISYDLASYNVVEANMDQTRYILENYVDIIFANEEEARVFTGMEPLGAIEELARLCKVAIVKTGKNGSMVYDRGEIRQVRALPAEVRDTTGAGDLYAAGFLYGYLSGATPEQCLKMGAMLAKEVIEVIGSKLQDDQWERIWQQIPIILED